MRRHWRANRLDEARAELERIGTEQVGAGLLRLKALVLIASDDEEGAQRALDRLAERVQDADGKERAATIAWIEALRASREVEDATWLTAAEACRSAIAHDPDDPVSRE